MIISFPFILSPASSPLPLQSTLADGQRSSDPLRISEASSIWTSNLLDEVRAGRVFASHGTTAHWPGSLFNAMILSDKPERAKQNPLVFVCLLCAHGSMSF
jgi:hypothetical protein